MVKVSVVIPVYNVEEFLEPCLDSIVNQTLDDIEIICVNDGSTDKSLDILNSYAKNDDRFTVISQENGGHAVATNRGMELANGKYLYLMDSDDLLDLTALEKTFNHAEKTQADFVIFQALNYGTEEDKYFKTGMYSMVKVADFIGESTVHYKELGALIFKISVTPWSKLYNNQFVKECGAKFPEGLIFDDNVFFWEVLFNSKRIAFYREFLFTRRWYSFSSTTTGDQRFLDSIDIQNLIIETFKKYGMFEQHKRKLYNHKLKMGLYRFEHIKPEFKKMYFDKLKNELQRIVSEGLYDDYMEYLDDKHKKVFHSFLYCETPREVELELDNYESAIALNNLNEEKNELFNKFVSLKKENFQLLNSESYVGLKEKNRILTIQNRCLQDSILSLKKEKDKPKKSKGLNLRNILKRS